MQRTKEDDFVFCILFNEVTCQNFIVSLVDAKNVRTEHWYGGSNRAKTDSTQRDTRPCPSATLSTTNPTWSALSANPSLRAEGPALTACAMARLQMIFDCYGRCETAA